ncbi:uncharacterized protein RHIMIDRAFT_235107 [Rhizopus microsporus ATCC 52813]|uniref:Uncharacterized protein n=1 Tax=Rhizopus microsporus ATCC 52813 TaxID=1340429 RepID=A0A2G4T447_RHIZD|nr:uncharacterized protein RHIMIDRAFT_235107 [Rhizopus microsporus ATCC 52813]PHZ15769.1 hypothetical protein RHIMIDRAFT_235107 [Rhizopus microsporus ATCC 52813]
MSSPPTDNLRQTCSRSREQYRRLRITASSQQTSMADSAFRFQEQNRPAVGAPRYGLLCRPYESPPTKARILDDGFEFNRDRRTIDPMKINLYELLPQPSMESNSTLLVQDPPGTSSSSHYHRLSLNQRSLVAPFNTNGSVEPNSYSANRYYVHNSFHSLAISSEALETLRLESLKSGVGSIPGLSDVSSSILLDRRLENSTTNRAYRRGQFLFLEWSLQHRVNINGFSAALIVNFLSDMHYQFGYSSSTFPSFCSSILAFHQNKASLDNELHLVNNLLDTLARREPPKQIHRPTIDISPALNHIRQIQSTTSTPLPLLQKKTAFLLAMTAFLRPSDLHRIDLAFIALRDHPSLSHLSTRSLLFVNSRCPQEPLATSTISKWLRNMIRISTEERNVSVRSIASLLALCRDIPKGDIITLRNRTNSSTFENHYRREHMSCFNFTQILLLTDSSTSTEEERVDFDMDDQEEDTFFDAMQE